MHKINNVEFGKFINNPIKDMLSYVLYKKINIVLNNDSAIFSLELIDMIKKRLVNKWFLKKLNL